MTTGKMTLNVGVQLHSLTVTACPVAYRCRNGIVLLVPVSSLQTDRLTSLLKSYRRILLVCPVHRGCTVA